MILKVSHSGHYVRNVMGAHYFCPHVKFIDYNRLRVGCCEREIHTEFRIPMDMIC